MKGLPLDYKYAQKRIYRRKTAKTDFSIRCLKWTKF